MQAINDKIKYIIDRPDKFQSIVIKLFNSFINDRLGQIY